MEPNQELQLCTKEITSLQNHFSTLNIDGEATWNRETRTLPSGQVPLWIEYDDRLKIEEVLAKVTEDHNDHQQSLNVMGSDEHRLNYFRHVEHVHVLPQH